MYYRLNHFFFDSDILRSILAELEAVGERGGENIQDAVRAYACVHVERATEAEQTKAIGVRRALSAQQSKCRCGG